MPKLVTGPSAVTFFAVGDNNNELDLLGHALDKWCEKQYSEPFAKNLARIARANGTVRLLLMKSDGSSQKRRSIALGLGDHGYTERIKTSLAFIYHNILDKIPEENRKNLHIRDIEEIDFPYMMVKTDQRVVVSPYLARKGSYDNLLLVLMTGTKYTPAFTDDFERLFNSGEEVDWTPYAKQNM